MSTFYISQKKTKLGPAGKTSNIPNSLKPIDTNGHDLIRCLATVVSHGGGASRVSRHECPG